MSIVRIVTRPVRAETWRELAYVVLGLPLSVLVFGLELAVLVSGSVLLITLIGVPILLAGAYMNRFFADVERRRAGFLLRARIEGGYRDASGVGFWRRARIVGGDPQTWKDFLCMLVLIFLGFGFGVASLTLWASALGWATLPAWWWIPPPGTVVDLGSWSVDRWSHALLVGAVGLAATVPVAWLVAGFARGQALLTRALLAPSERQLLRTRVEELSRTRAGAVDAQAEALERIERDLHDGAQARLVSVALELGRAREKLDADPAAAAALVESAHEDAKTAIAELRELVRGIHPAVLADRGLDAAVSALAGASAVPVSLDVHLAGPRPPRAVEAAAYFVIAESFANVAKHADAEHAWVRVAQRDGKLEVEVRDDGRGGADPGLGTGLAGLRRRVEALDGTLRVESPPAAGTLVRVELPCES